MTTGASIGWKSEFWLDNASDTLTQLAGIVSISPPSPEIGEVETTDLDATNRWRSFIPTLRDPGNITVVMNYVGNSATDVLVRAAFADAVIRDWKVIYSDDAGADERQITGDGFVNGLSEPEITVDGVKQVTMTIRVTGAITEAAAS